MILQDTTFAIKSSGRAESVKRLVSSIQRKYPLAKILIADDGVGRLEERIRTSGQLHIHQMPYDSGLSAGRNLLVDLANTKYFVSLDDDFEFTEKTDVISLIRMLESYGAAIVGGPVGDRPGFGFRLVRDKSTLRQVAMKGAPARLTCNEVHIVANFFVAVTNVLRSVRWDDTFKLGEHEDFFLRLMNAKHRVLMCPFSPIKHTSSTSWYDQDVERLGVYEKRRRRAFTYLQLFLKKHNIQRYVTHDGTLIASNIEATVALQNSFSAQHGERFRHWLDTVKVSVILVNWSRPRNLHRIIRTLKNADHIGEIVIWNNNNQHQLDAKHFDHGVKVHNSEYNENTFGRWRACGELAKHDLCYFIDDDFLPLNFLQLFVSIERDPLRLHAAGYVKLVWNDLRWGVESTERGIHSSFSWLGHGSIINRTLAIKFLEQTADMNLGDIPICDNAFALWTNRYPALYSDNPQSDGLTGKYGFSKGDILQNLNYARVNALNLLLKNVDRWYPNRNSKDELPLISSMFQNRCGVLLTNIRPRAYSSNFKVISELETSWKYIHTSEEAKGAGVFEEFMSDTDFSLYNAIDKDANSFWRTNKSLSKGEFFVIDLMKLGNVGQLRISAWRGLRDLIVSFSNNFEDWYDYNFVGLMETKPCNSRDNRCHNYTYDFDGFKARYVRFDAAWDFDEPLAVWEIQTICNEFSYEATHSRGTHYHL